MTARVLETDQQAEDLLRTAQQAAYRLPPHFPGFVAGVRVSGGAAAAAGAVRASGPSRLDLTFDIADDGELCAWARREITSMVSHRWAQPYEDGDGRYAKALGPDDANLGGRLVSLQDDPYSSAYRVAEGQVSEVHRTMGAVRFTIVMLSRTEAGDGRMLPACFAVHHWDPGTGRLVRSDTYTDAFVEIAGVLLPQRRRVVSASDAGLERREVRLVDHVLLPTERS